MRQQRDMFERRTFWPRPGRREVQGEFDFDRPCANCGYNLRGLPIGSPCPECGSIGGITLGDEPLPWEERRNPLTFIHTALLILFRPHDAARALWAPRRLDLPAAQAFRRWSLLVATPVLCAIAWIITSRVIGRTAATWCLVFDAAAIILWLNAATIGPVAFFRDKASGILLKRVQTLAHYTCAPLVPLAVPAQVALLLVTRDTIVASEPGWLLAAAVHVGVLVGLMGLGLIFMAWLMYETVNVSAPGAFAFTFAAATGALGSAAVLLICLPAMFAAMIATILT